MNRYLNDNFAPSTRSAAFDLDVTGEIPPTSTAATCASDPTHRPTRATGTTGSWARAWCTAYGSPRVAPVVFNRYVRAVGDDFRRTPTSSSTAVACSRSSRPAASPTR